MCLIPPRQTSRRYSSSHDPTATSVIMSFLSKSFTWTSGNRPDILRYFRDQPWLHAPTHVISIFTNFGSDSSNRMSYGNLPSAVGLNSLGCDSQIGFRISGSPHRAVESFRRPLPVNCFNHSRSMEGLTCIHGPESCWLQSPSGQFSGASAVRHMRRGADKPSASRISRVRLGEGLNSGMWAKYPANSTSL